MRVGAGWQRCPQGRLPAAVILDYLHTQSEMKLTNAKLVKTPKEIELFIYLDRPLSYDYTQPKQKGVKRETSEEEKLENRNRSIQRSKGKLRRLVNANASQWHTISGKTLKPLFLTLTFAENLTDLQTANYEFTKFIQRLNYMCGYKSSILKYLVVPEFQKRGAVHFHALIFNMPFVEDIYDRLNQIWTNGFLLIKAVDKVKNVGAYISKYMSKGHADSRLMANKAYFCSKGLLKPEEHKDEARIQNILDKLPAGIKPFEKEYKDPYYGNVTYRKYQL